MGLPKKQVRIGVAFAILVVPALAAALGGATVFGRNGSDWPPKAWEDGDMSRLSLAELALLATDVAPSVQNRRNVQEGLAPLDRLPSDYTDVTRIVLEGLAKARWHQLQAVRELDAHQLATLSAAKDGHPLPGGWHDAMDAVDHRELAKGLLALTSANEKATAILDRLNREPTPSTAGALAAWFGAPVPEQNGLRLRSPPATATTIAQATGVAQSDVVGLEAALQAMPESARAALYAIAESLIEVSRSQSEPESIVGLGHAVDAAHDVLLAWSTLSMAEQLVRLHQGPGEMPTANSIRLPLHFGVPALRNRDAPLGPPPGLADALQVLATTLGDHEFAAATESETMILAETLGPEAERALAQILHQSQRYIVASAAANLAPVPSVLVAEPRLLQSWAKLEGLPPTGSAGAQALLSARPYLAAQLEAALAREDLLSAIEEAVPAFTAPTSNPTDSNPLAGVMLSAALPSTVPCEQGRVRVPGQSAGPAYIHFDPCGNDDVWGDADRAMLVIDIGGNDTYEGAYGTAPLGFASVASQPAIESPIAIHLDLGGSDHYNASGLDCVLAAACNSSLAPPLAILVDWTDAPGSMNWFESGNRSQGFAANGTALLVEQAAAGSQLESAYVAKNWSQGASHRPAASVQTGLADLGVAALIRIVGDDSKSIGRFTAEDHSQGSAAGSGAIAALLNVAGADSQSPDTYVAGMDSQGSFPSGAVVSSTDPNFGWALLADIVGPGGQSNDHYEAGNRSRAYGMAGYFLDFLHPETVDRKELVPTSLPGADIQVASTGLRSSSDDTYVLLAQAVGLQPLGNGYATKRGTPINVAGVQIQPMNPTLYLDVGGSDTYPANTLQGNGLTWNQPPPSAGASAPGITGRDTQELQDRDGDLLPPLVEALINGTVGATDEHPDDAYGTGRRFLIDPGSGHPFLNATYGFVVMMTGDTQYGSGFSSGILLDLSGNDRHHGRTASAAGHRITGPYSASQNLASLSLDLEGDDEYVSLANGSLGFGAGAAGILLDLGGNDRYSGRNFTQGVGVEGGLGILADLKRRANGSTTSPPEVNRFHIEGSPGQGYGSTGIGIFLADGDHNTFSDGQRVPGLPFGAEAKEGGARINGGTNTPPRIVLADWSGSEAGAAIAGMPYTFTAAVVDDEGDVLQVCWSFADAQVCRQVEGNGTVQIEHSWRQVPTDARKQQTALGFDFNLSVTDPGGQMVFQNQSIQVHNLPPRLTGEPLRKPAELRPDTLHAFQLPFVPGDHVAKVSDDAVLVRWDGGTVTGFNATAVDWAKAKWGARIEIPSGSPDGLPGVDVVGQGPDTGVANAIDDNLLTDVQFTHRRDRDDAQQDGVARNAPASLVVSFEGSRQIRQVGLQAARSSEGSAPEIRLAIEALRVDGSTLPLGVVTMNSTFACTPCQWNLTEFPDLTGLVIRQIVVAGDTRVSHAFVVADIFARGPGAWHSWDTPGTHTIDYNVLDAHGGRNGTTTSVQLMALAAVEDHQTPLRFIDVAGRGPAKDVTLASGKTYELVLESQVSAPADVYCVDWGDGTITCPSDSAGMVPNPGEQLVLTKNWTEPGDYEVVAEYYAEGLGSSATSWPLGTVHAERALDITVAPNAGSLFFAFDDRDSWYDGDAWQYQAIVDMGGDDLYYGTVAASFSINDVLPAPSLLIDVRGNDVYASPSGSTQAYATQLGIAFLADGGGDDVFVSDGSAQAAARRGGAAALIALGGHDRFNPVPASSTADLSPRAVHSVSPGLLDARRPMGNGPDFVQGAAEDGIAILVAAGTSTFHAGSRSQGHGAHEVPTIDHYAAAGAGSACTPPPVQGNPAAGGEFSPAGALCFLGITNVRSPDSGTGFYTTIGTDGQPNQDFFLCQYSHPTLPATVNNCKGNDIKVDNLLQFLVAGPRYNPGFGALVHFAGPATYSASDEAQGSARNAGRGLLFDAEGASMLLATSRAQAFSDAGTTATILGGASVLRLGRAGQATVCDGGVCQPTEASAAGPRGPEGGLTSGAIAAILLTTGTRDATCAQDCNQGGLDQTLVSPLLPPRAVTVTAPAGPVLAAQPFEVVVGLSPEDYEPIQLVIQTIPFASWDDSGQCGGEPIASATTVFDGLKEGIEPFAAVLDLAALAGPGHPLLPAGCTQVHAFARPAPSDVGGMPMALTQWGHGSDSLLLLPPARGLQLESAAGLSTNGIETVPFRVHVEEPLVAHRLPDLQFQALDGNQVVADTQTFATEAAWQGNARWVNWIPPPGIPEGQYDLRARTRWSNVEGWSDWLAVGASIKVDVNPPELGVDLSALSGVVRYKQDIRASGTARDESGVAAVLLRLVDDEGGVIDLHGPCALAQTLLAGLGDQAACAQLDSPGAKSVNWRANLRSSNAVAGGNLTIQAAAVDTGGSIRNWMHVKTVLLDGLPPSVTRIVTASGFTAAGPTPADDNATVRLLVHACDRVPDEALCIPGGVDVGRVSMSAARLVEGTVERIALTRNQTVDQDLQAGGVVLGYTWASEAPIPEGHYELFILAGDLAGNLFDHNPGRMFAVDRTPPTLEAPTVLLPMMTNPMGQVVQQTMAKLNDTIRVSVVGSDANPSLLSVSLVVVGDTSETVTQPWTTSTAQAMALPISEIGNSSTLEVEVQAIDLAGNQATRSVQVPFASPIAFAGEPVVKPRSDSVFVNWTTSRALNGSGDGMWAILQDAAGTPLQQAKPEALPQAAGYSVRFTKLGPGQEYRIALHVWDGANHTLQKTLAARTFEEPVGTALQITAPTVDTYSGIVPIHGRLFPGTARIEGDLSLHSADLRPVSFTVPGNPDLLSTLGLEAALGAQRDFTVLWDSRDAVPPGAGAQSVPLTMRFDDGSTNWNDTITFRIDNTAPTITPTVLGPEENGGWRNGTVIVRAAASDDTQLAPPATNGSAPNLGHRTSIVPGPEHATDSVTLTSDGTYLVRFVVLDGAVPPNVANVSTTIRLDRTLPALQAVSGLPVAWTSQAIIPLAVDGSDHGSGLDGYRMRVGTGNWTPWNMTAPANASLHGLAEGEHWIDIELRDVARNVRRETLSAILDRTAPNVVEARWVGITSAGLPVLQVVARDPLSGASQPSGVDGIRFATNATGPWSVWTPAGTSGVFAINAGNGTWLQLRDRAGNLGGPHFVNASQPETEVAVPVQSQGMGALTGGRVAPREGGPETRFTFSIRVLPLVGEFPWDVILHVAGQATAMLPEGPVMDDGARIYTATVSLPPSRLDDPHMFRVSALYDEASLETGDMPGPIVFALGLDGPSLDTDHSSQGLPNVAGAGLALLIVVASALRRRRLE